MAPITSTHYKDHRRLRPSSLGSKVLSPLTLRSLSVTNSASNLLNLLAMVLRCRPSSYWALFGSGLPLSAGSAFCFVPKRAPPAGSKKPRGLGSERKCPLAPPAAPIHQGAGMIPPFMATEKASPFWRTKQMDAEEPMSLLKETGRHGSRSFSRSFSMHVFPMLSVHSRDVRICTKQHFDLATTWLDTFCAGAWQETTRL